MTATGAGMRSALMLAASLSILVAQAAAQTAPAKPKKPSQPAAPTVTVPGATKPSPTAGGSTGTVAAPATLPASKLRPLLSLPAPVLRPPGTGTATLAIPYRTTTARLGAVGRGHEVATPSFSPVRLRTSPLGAVGGGAVTTAPFSPIRVRTAPLGAVGRPPGG